MDICALTGKKGRYVDSHLLPKAFMRRVQNSPAIELDGISRPKKRYSHGWTDKKLVTGEGESILSLYDDEAVHDFAKSGLTYRQRGDPITNQLAPIPYQPAESVKIIVRDMDRLRLFALSLLWRCAASNRPEFTGVKMRSKMLHELRQMVLTGNAGSPEDSPAYLGVFDSEEELIKLAPSTSTRGPLRAARFFLDGYILYVSHTKKNSFMSRLGDLLLGRLTDVAAVIVLGSANGRHAEMAEELIEQTAKNYSIPYHPLYG